MGVCVGEFVVNKLKKLHTDQSVFMSSHTNSLTFLPPHQYQTSAAEQMVIEVARGGPQLDSGGPQPGTRQSKSETARRTTKNRSSESEEAAQASLGCCISLLQPLTQVMALQRPVLVL